MHLGEWMRKHVHTYMYSSNSETIKKYFNTHFYLEVFSRILIGVEEREVYRQYSASAVIFNLRWSNA